METPEKFCKDSFQTFFNAFSLISHQINSFSQFIWISQCTGCEVEPRLIKKRRVRLKACCHYIWKSQRWKF